MIHGEIEVAKDLPRKGPSGTYSQAWMSLALQSLTSVTPNTWSSNRPARSPRAVGVPTTNPTSASMSSLAEGPKSPAPRCPDGLMIGVPDATTVPALPW